MKFLIIVLLLISAVYGQVEQSRNVNPYSFTPKFYFDLANYKSEIPGKTKVDVFISVPYSSLQFVKEPDGFNAKYSIMLTFFDDDKDNIIFERIWNEKVRVSDFGKTVSGRSFNLSYRSFDLQPDVYILQCIVEDLDSRKTFSREAEVKVMEFNDILEISDLILIADRTADENGERVIPNVSRVVTNKDKGISFFFEIYSDIDRSVKIEYLVEDQKREIDYTQKLARELKSGTNVIYHTIEKPRFTLGDYNLVVQVLEDDQEILKGIGKTIRSQIYGYPSSIKDLDLAIEQMIYIASNDEVDKIKAADSYDEKLSRFMEFWKTKDPSPATEENEVLTEYFRRIEYSNDKFTSFYDGWRTDMGMIYTTLGPPDYVERYPFAEGSKPYEVWHFYDLNRRFVFVDQTGFGDYRLLNPVYGDWYRYRN